PDDFFSDVERARLQGFSETAALADRFTWCMAAPIRDGHGAINRTLCFVLPVDTPEPRRNQLLELLQDRARGLSLTGG
ncbi:IclR family transcriptional regulator, partial [Mesorhizobium sp. M2E.F.Ca.ET.166.01.1.1]